MIACMTTAAMPALATSEADAPLAWLLAGIVVTQTADFIALPLLEYYVTVRAERVVGCDARSTDLEKSHDGLLCCRVVSEHGHTADRVTARPAVCRDPAHRGGNARCAL